MSIGVYINMKEHKDNDNNNNNADYYKTEIAKSTCLKD